jgi:hypothetical protein
MGVRGQRQKQRERLRQLASRTVGLLLLRDVAKKKCFDERIFSVGFFSVRVSQEIVNKSRSVVGLFAHRSIPSPLLPQTPIPLIRVILAVHPCIAVYRTPRKSRRQRDRHRGPHRRFLAALGMTAVPLGLTAAPLGMTVPDSESLPSARQRAAPGMTSLTPTQDTYSVGRTRR